MSPEEQDACDVVDIMLPGQGLGIGRSRTLVNGLRSREAQIATMKDALKKYGEMRGNGVDFGVLARETLDALSSPQETI